MILGCEALIAKCNHLNARNLTFLAQHDTDKGPATG